MTGTDPAPPVEYTPPASWRARLLDRAEEWIYELNVRGHWIFQLYDGLSEAWAKVFFRRIRRHAAEIDEEVRGREDTAQLRFLTPADAPAFAELLEGFDFKYLPPHALDAETAHRALRRRSYLPFGIFYEGKLQGYLLLRFFFPWRLVLGIWSLPELYNRGFSRSVVKVANDFSRREGIPHYCTVPLDNLYSLKTAQWAGFEIVRTNRRFYVLQRRD